MRVSQGALRISSVTYRLAVRNDIWRKGRWTLMLRHSMTAGGQLGRSWTGRAIGWIKSSYPSTCGVAWGGSWGQLGVIAWKVLGHKEYRTNLDGITTPLQILRAKSGAGHRYRIRSWSSVCARVKMLLRDIEERHRRPTKLLWARASHT